jgi:hypothetical protein
VEKRMFFGSTPHPKRFLLLRPLGWSVVIHLFLFMLFSVSAGRTFRTRPVGVLINWATVTGGEAVILLQPHTEPNRVAIASAHLPGDARLSSAQDRSRLVSARLRDLRVAYEPESQAGSLRINPPSGKSVRLRELAAPGPAWFDASELAVTVSDYVPPVPEISRPRLGLTLQASPPEWKNLAITWPEGTKAADLGVEGPALLTERPVLSFSVPAGGTAGPQASYRFAVGPEGRVTRIIPLSAPDADWSASTFDALLTWRFAPLPSWGPQEELWGRISFE